MELAFDSHAHWDHLRFDDDRDLLLPTLPQSGVGAVMNAGCNLASSRRSVELAKQYPHVYAAVGTHPEDAAEWSEDVEQVYRELAKEPKVRAIGEIGLDYYYGGTDKERQKTVFAAQLQLARELRLPVIVHDRDAHGDAMDLVRTFDGVTGVFHCFSGSVEMAQELVRRGWYIGFTGVLTFRNARKAVEVAAALPIDRLLIETDCPYMAPEPHRGKRCDSRMVRLTAGRLAEIRGISEDEAIRLTRENAERLFGL